MARFFPSDLSTVGDSLFDRFARATANAMGTPAALGLALLIIVVWAVSGPIFAYSDTWQLGINTGTTIITFLMVFVIQHTQNRDAQAMQMKLNEIVRAIPEAHTALLNLEDLTDEEIERFHAYYARLAEAARKKLRKGESDLGCPEDGDEV